jgi:hypothetical protein
MCARLRCEQSTLALAAGQHVDVIFLLFFLYVFPALAAEQHVDVIFLNRIFGSDISKYDIEICGCSISKYESKNKI